jgi:hypothetical protein
MGKKAAPPWLWMAVGVVLLGVGITLAVTGASAAPDFSSLQRLEVAVQSLKQRPAQQTRTPGRGVSTREGTWDLAVAVDGDVRWFDLGHLTTDQIRRTAALTGQADVVALHDGATVWQLETPSGVALGYASRKAGFDAERLTQLGVAGMTALLGLISIGVGSMQSRQLRMSGALAQRT